MRWVREADGAVLMMRGARLMERRGEGQPWQIVRVIEGSASYRRQAARLYASTHGFIVGGAVVESVATVAADDAPRPRTPGTKCVVMAPPPDKRVNLEVARIGPTFWVRRCEDGAEWATSDHLATAIGVASGHSPDARHVLAAAHRVAAKLPTERGDES